MDSTERTGTPVITLSEAAVKEVKRLMNVQGITEGGLRVGVKGGGCSGLSYTVNFDEKISQYDSVYEIDGIKVIVDAKSAIYLQDTQLDFSKDLTGGAFRFVNPNAQKTCGCGESFSA
ncbi:MAG: HesB/IscA family protein [Nitrospiraceae bacterium]